MIKLTNYKLKQNKNISKSKLSPTKLGENRAKKNELGKHCWSIFEKLRPQLIIDYENWFIAIEPETEHYLIAPKLDELVEQIKQEYPNNEVKLTIFRLNQVGSCGKI